LQYFSRLAPILLRLSLIVSVHIERQMLKRNE
jgi:hypothetical protein